MPDTTRDRSHVPNTAVVLVAHTMSGLAVTRSLGRKGVRVVLVNHFKPSLAALSRYCADTIDVPSLFHHADQAANILKQRLADLEPAIIFAPTDEALVFLHRYPDVFAPHICAVPPPEMAAWALDKAKTVRLAQQLQLPVPRTWFPEDFPSPQELADAVTFPCVLKPRTSRYWKSDGTLTSTGAVRTFHDRAALLDALQHAQGPPPILQEFVQGQAKGIYMLTDHGNPTMVFAHRRVREANPRGSGACLAESVPVDEGLAEISRRLLAEIHWHGVAMVEFKVGRQPFIIELNGRFWNSLPLSMQAGCDFPWALYRMYAGLGAPEPRPYKVGKQCRSLQGDLAHLYHALRGRPRDWPGPFPTRCGALLGFLRACLPDVGSYTFAADDPLPGLAEMCVRFVQKPVRR